jgi:hypothetical protein
MSNKLRIGIFIWDLEGSILGANGGLHCCCLGLRGQRRGSANSGLRNWEPWCWRRPARSQPTWGPVPVQKWGKDSVRLTPIELPPWDES